MGKPKFDLFSTDLVFAQSPQSYLSSHLTYYCLYYIGYLNSEFFCLGAVWLKFENTWLPLPVEIWIFWCWFAVHKIDVTL